ncbi:MAG: hypothetical protein FWD01_03200 [Defluviitaleaceae bacterium]|nr:hypothetical protein [Defluviitaleaceae bacterium]
MKPKPKLKIRYTAAALLAAASALITPLAVTKAYELRGYTAFGGEYLIFPLGILLVYLMLDVAKRWDKYKKSKVNPKSKTGKTRKED